MGVAIGKHLISAYFVGLSAMKLVAFRKQRLAMNKLQNNDANNANNQSLLSLVIYQMYVRRIIIVIKMMRKRIQMNKKARRKRIEK